MEGQCPRTPLSVLGRFQNDLRPAISLGKPVYQPSSSPYINTDPNVQSVGYSENINPELDDNPHCPEHIQKHHGPSHSGVELVETGPPLSHQGQSSEEVDKAAYNNHLRMAKGEASAAKQLYHYWHALQLHRSEALERRVEKLKARCEDEGLVSSEFVLHELKGYTLQPLQVKPSQNPAADTLEHKSQAAGLSQESEGEEGVAGFGRVISGSKEGEKTPQSGSKAGVKYIPRAHGCKVYQNLVTDDVWVRWATEGQSFDTAVEQRIKKLTKQSTQNVKLRGKRDNHGNGSTDSQTDDEDEEDNEAEETYQLRLTARKSVMKARTLVVPHDTYSRIYEYQREALAWMWSVHHSPSAGGVLGDDMGLGKTVQVSTYINSLFVSGQCKRVLLVAPVSVMPHWQAELGKWCPSVRVIIFHGSATTTAKKRAEALAKIERKGGVVITTYGMVLSETRGLAFLPPASEDNASQGGGGGDGSEEEEGEDEEGEGDEAEGGSGHGNKRGGKKKGGKLSMKARLKALKNMGGEMPSTAWDYVVLDEGHKIKNPDIALSIAMRLLPAKHRLLLTGTPIQNSLDEVWSLFDYVCGGTLLGDRRTFNREFANKIKDGQSKDATDREIEVSKRTAIALGDLMRPFFLRREKAWLDTESPTKPVNNNKNKNSKDPNMISTAMNNASNTSNTNDTNSTSTGDTEPALPIQSPSLSPETPLDRHGSTQTIISESQISNSTTQSSVLPSSSPSSSSTNTTIPSSMKPPSLRGIRKNDLVLWIRLSPTQESLYRNFVNSPQVRDALNSTRSPLAALTILKKICDHPRLLNDGMKYCGDIGVNPTNAIPSQNPNEASEATQLGVSHAMQMKGDINEIEYDALLLESSKLKALVELLQIHKTTGHRTLVFSQSKLMLNIIEKVMTYLSMTYVRFDGDIVSPQERQSRIDRFNKSPEILACLVTTTAGGVGVNLTGADRVIIFDPAWNPATDSQAVDRAYRLGQTRDVVIYRFVTCGTIEETIYRKQVFKNSLMTSTLKANKDLSTRYFSKKDLREVFSLSRSLCYSETQRELAKMHPPDDRRSYPELDQHIEELTRGCEENMASSRREGINGNTGSSTDSNIEGQGESTNRFNVAGVTDHDLLFSKEDTDSLKRSESDGFVSRSQTSSNNSNKYNNNNTSNNRDRDNRSGVMSSILGTMLGTNMNSHGSNEMTADDEVSASKERLLRTVGKTHRDTEKIKKIKRRVIEEEEEEEERKRDRRGSGRQSDIEEGYETEMKTKGTKGSSTQGEVERRDTEVVIRRKRILVDDDEDNNDTTGDITHTGGDGDQNQSSSSSSSVHNMIDGDHGRRDSLDMPISTIKTRLDFNNIYNEGDMETNNNKNGEDVEEDDSSPMRVKKHVKRIVLRDDSDEEDDVNVGDEGNKDERKDSALDISSHDYDDKRSTEDSNKTETAHDNDNGDNGNVDGDGNVDNDDGSGDDDELVDVTRLMDGSYIEGEDDGDGDNGNGNGNDDNIVESNISVMENDNIGQLSADLQDNASNVTLHEEVTPLSPPSSTSPSSSHGLHVDGLLEDQSSLIDDNNHDCSVSPCQGNQAQDDDPPTHCTSEQSSVALVPMSPPHPHPRADPVLSECAEVNDDDIAALADMFWNQAVLGVEEQSVDEQYGGEQGDQFATQYENHIDTKDTESHTSIEPNSINDKGSTMEQYTHSPRLGAMLDDAITALRSISDGLMKGSEDELLQHIVHITNQLEQEVRLSRRYEGDHENEHEGRSEGRCHDVDQHVVSRIRAIVNAVQGIAATTKALT